MDKTKMYVRMADCDNIQLQWVPKPGDFISHTMTNPITKDVDNEIIQLCMCHEWGKEVEKHEWGEKVTWIEYEGQDYIARFNKPIWLPTQDQIQKMLRKYYTLDGLLDCFNTFWNPNCEFNKAYPGNPKGHGIFHFFHSAEQLWLAFYMIVKHSKTWDGEKWVKSK